MDTGIPLSVPSLDARVGLILAEKYRLDDVLGEGGSATVFSGTHRNGHLVVVKVLHPLLAWSPDSRRRFEREAFIANSIAHPGIIPVIDDGVASEGAPFYGAPFQVLPRLYGQTLEARLEKGPLTWQSAAYLGCNLAAIVAAAHEAGVIHRDLKPGNIFLERPRSVRLFDFGVAVCVHLSRLTSDGAIVGTLGYMSPEQALGRTDIDASSDVYSLGAVMYAAVSGILPHGEPVSLFDALRRARFEPVVPVSRVAPSVPSALAEVIDRSLDITPARRFADAGDMCQALVRATGIHPGCRCAMYGRGPCLRCES